MSEKHDYLLSKWKLLIEDRVNSGMNVVDWCAANGYTKHAYYYWLAKLRKNNYPEAVSSLSVSTVPDNPGSIVEIPVSSRNNFLSVNPSISSPSAIIRKGELSVELYSASDPAFIKQLIEAISYA